MSLEKVSNNAKNNKLPVFKVQDKKNSSNQNPFNKKPETKAPKKKPNSLFELDTKTREFTLKENSFWKIILNYLLALIGKKKKWEDAKNHLKLMQQRISKFEAVINNSSEDKVSSHKNYEI